MVTQINPDQIDPSTGSENQVLKKIAGVVVFDNETVDLSTIMYGNGSDGDVTISAGTTQLTSDMFYHDLEVNGDLDPNGYRIYISGKLTGNGKILRNGNNGGNGGNYDTGSEGTGGGTAGATLNQGSLNAEIGAGAGGNRAWNATPGEHGGNGEDSTPAYTIIGGVVGGDGGDGYSSAGGDGGHAGTATRGAYYNRLYSLEALLTYFMAPASATTSFHLFDSNLFGTTQYKVCAGSGGGGGGGARGGIFTTGGAGGGAGSNGGLIRISVNEIDWTGTFEAIGGNGGNGGEGTGDAGCGGGGSGGQGGVVYMIYKTITALGTVTLTGGTKGLKGISGLSTGATDGNNGNTGVLIQLQL